MVTTMKGGETTPKRGKGKQSETSKKRRNSDNDRGSEACCLDSLGRNWEGEK